MRIFNYINQTINEGELLTDALKVDVNKKNIISFVGAGGKTSLIYALGNEINDIGKKVIITTTTHMFKPEKNVIITGNSDDIESLLRKTNVVTVGMPCSDEDLENMQGDLQRKELIKYLRKTSFSKIKGVETELATQFLELADFVLVEADGSKGLPLKVPAEHEPVILDGSNLVVGVCGIDAIGKSIKETCHRPNLVSKFLDTDTEHIINEYDVAKILSSVQGQRKNVKCDYKVIINKADTIRDIEKAKDILKKLSNFGIDETIITTFMDK